MMYVGALQLTLRIPLSASLKDKRQVVQSVLQRVRNKFEVAAAEIATLESWQVATIGALLCEQQRAPLRRGLGACAALHRGDATGRGGDRRATRSHHDGLVSHEDN